MCGIAGYVRRGGLEPSPGQVDQLTGALTHRGPDGEGRLKIVRRLRAGGCDT